MDSEQANGPKLDRQLVGPLVAGAAIPVAALAVIAVGALVFVNDLDSLTVFGGFAALAAAATAVVAVIGLRRLFGSLDAMVALLDELVSAQADLERGDAGGLERMQRDPADQRATLSPALDLVEQLRQGFLDTRGEQNVAVRRGVAAAVSGSADRTLSLLERQMAVLDRATSGDGAAAGAALAEARRLAVSGQRSVRRQMVLAGVTGERRREPTAMVPALIAFLSHDSGRVRIDPASFDAAVVGHSDAVDVAQLVAELIDNGLEHSPPDRSVVVEGGHTPSGDYTISVIDDGDGMADKQLEVANSVLGDPPESGSALDQCPGLVVSGRLAQRLGATVALAPAGRRGLEALVRLPRRLFLDPASVDATEPVGPRPVAASPRTGGRARDLIDRFATTPPIAAVGRTTPDPSGPWPTDRTRAEAPSFLLAQLTGAGEAPSSTPARSSRSRPPDAMAPDSPSATGRLPSPEGEPPDSLAEALGTGVPLAPGLIGALDTDDDRRLAPKGPNDPAPAATQGRDLNEIRAMLARNRVRTGGGERPGGDDNDAREDRADGTTTERGSGRGRGPDAGPHSA